jgi:hypothetical protein
LPRIIAALDEVSAAIPGDEVAGNVANQRRRFLPSAEFALLGKIACNYSY